MVLLQLERNTVAMQLIRLVDCGCVGDDAAFARPEVKVKAVLHVVSWSCILLAPAGEVLGNGFRAYVLVK